MTFCTPSGQKIPIIKISDPRTDIDQVFVSAQKYGALVDERVAALLFTDNSNYAKLYTRDALMTILRRRRLTDALCSSTGKPIKLLIGTKKTPRIELIATIDSTYKDPQGRLLKIAVETTTYLRCDVIIMHRKPVTLLVRRSKVADIVPA